MQVVLRQEQDGEYQQVPRYTDLSDTSGHFVHGHFLYTRVFLLNCFLLAKNTLH